MNALKILTSNYIINAGFLAWFLAQLIKTVLAYIPSKKVNWERLVGSGGMPSSHSAFVCAIALAMGRKTGYASPEFALSIALAGIVMYDAMGVGLAAPQVGMLKRIVVIDIGEGPIVLINPEILETSGEQTGDEGCLSVPGMAGQVTRPNYVKVKALDEDMNEVEYEGEGLLARAFCHEIDHLDGHMYTELVEGELHQVSYDEDEE